LRNEQNFNKNPKKLRILISPLDWGLGHATRCIPIINELVKLNCEVLIAADKQIYSLLKKEFPSIVFLRLKGYEIRYGAGKRGFPVKIFLQIPKVFFAIRRENKWLKKVVERYKIDAVISDNRFGMYSKSVPCIYITHQLFIETGNKWTSKIVQKIHYYFIKKYSKCWVPDLKERGLAGKLSHSEKIPSNVLYIGPLSRFKKLDVAKEIYELLICISGPEPQRSHFETIITAQLKNFAGKVLLVRGLPAEEKIYPGTETLKIVNHLPAHELNTAFEESKIVISRSGYTTIMDLVKLKKKAVLVPTPGQTEQEYLAKYLSEKKYFYSIRQKYFCLNEVLHKAADFPFDTLNTNSEEYKEIINGFVGSLKTGNFASQ